MEGMTPAGSDVPFAPFRRASALPKVDRTSAEHLPIPTNSLSARSAAAVECPGAGVRAWMRFPASSPG
jgi:hypothetical protein